MFTYLQKKCKFLGLFFKLELNLWKIWLVKLAALAEGEVAMTRVKTQIYMQLLISCFTCEVNFNATVSKGKRISAPYNTWFGYFSARK